MIVMVVVMMVVMMVVVVNEYTNIKPSLLDIYRSPSVSYSTLPKVDLNTLGTLGASSGGGNDLGDSTHSGSHSSLSSLEDWELQDRVEVPVEVVLDGLSHAALRGNISSSNLGQHATTRPHVNPKGVMGEGKKGAKGGSKGTTEGAKGSVEEAIDSETMIAEGGTVAGLELIDELGADLGTLSSVAFKNTLSSNNLIKLQQEYSDANDNNNNNNNNDENGSPASTISDKDANINHYERNSLDRTSGTPIPVHLAIPYNRHDDLQDSTMKVVVDAAIVNR